MRKGEGTSAQEGEGSAQTFLFTRQLERHPTASLSHPSRYLLLRCILIDPRKSCTVASCAHLDALGAFALLSSPRFLFPAIKPPSAIPQPISLLLPPNPNPLHASLFIHLPTLALLTLLLTKQLPLALPTNPPWPFTHPLAPLTSYHHPRARIPIAHSTTRMRLRAREVGR